MDRPAIARAVESLLSALGEDPARAGLRGTPDRVADSYAEIFSGYDVDPVALLEPLEGAEGSSLIMVKGVQMVSICEHHLLPFFGTATVAYLPGESGAICGLSKLSRLIDALSRRLQVQERLVAEAADAIEKALAPRGVFVMIEAEHMCMSIRGARKPGAIMTTVEARGSLDTPEERAYLVELSRQHDG